MGYFSPYSDRRGGSGFLKEGGSRIKTDKAKLSQRACQIQTGLKVQPSQETSAPVASSATAPVPQVVSHGIRPGTYKKSEGAPCVPEEQPPNRDEIIARIEKDIAFLKGQTSGPPVTTQSPSPQPQATVSHLRIVKALLWMAINRPIGFIGKYQKQIMKRPLPFQ